MRQSLEVIKTRKNTRHKEEAQCEGLNLVGVVKYCCTNEGMPYAAAVFHGV